MKSIRQFEAVVTYRDSEEVEREEKFPVCAEDFSIAQSLAERYVLEVLKLRDFELRMVGS